ncbi:MAG TPA: hypothetical protein VGH89_11655 [Pseudonocardia sp.]|jgi:hypothetical protein
MTTAVMLLAGSAVLLFGFVLGTRFAEMNMEARERRLARQRRALQDASAALRRRAAVHEIEPWLTTDDADRPTGRRRDAGADRSERHPEPTR